MTVKEFPTDEAERFRKIEDIIERFKVLGLPEKIIKDLEDWLAQEKGMAVCAPAAEETSQDEAIEGEGFHIDLTWLTQSQKELKWSDDTAKTFLVGQYKVSPAGTLEDVIKRLTREQAEEFVKEIQDRVAQKQTQLFT